MMLTLSVVAFFLFIGLSLKKLGFFSPAISVFFRCLVFFFLGFPLLPPSAYNRRRRDVLVQDRLRGM